MQIIAVLLAQHYRAITNAKKTSVKRASVHSEGIVNGERALSPPEARPLANIARPLTDRMHVLLVEDSLRLQESLRTGLQRCGYAVDGATDGEAGLRYARHNKYDVIVLDLMLPKVDGLTVLRQLREAGDSTHVLILTARDTVDDRVQGLRDGADDYLVKPFSFDELLARIEALVRRTYHSKNPVITIGPVTIDTTARTVTRDGDEIRLSKREYTLLEYLAFRKGQIVDRRQIEDHLYGERDLPMSNAVDRMMCTLRAKIESPGGTTLLQTRRGLGYVLDEHAS